MENFGGPPALAVVWLSLALVPVSALFSALCLALASFARSTKEGQYYLMPLLMLSLPMAVLPMIPGVELNLGNSLIPISGVVLLLKTLLEGSYLQALQYLPVVLAVTMAACWLAVRWAVEQFNKESVIFRESERFAVGLWLRHLMRDRGPTPSAAEGLFCGVLILVLTFIFRSAVAPPADFYGFARVTLVLQLAVILAPAVLMAMMLTAQSAADAAAAAAALEDDPRGRGAGGGHAPLHHCPELVDRASLPDGARDESARRRLANEVRLGRPGVADPLRGRRAGGLRRTGLSRLHPFRMPQSGQQLAGDRRQRDLLRRHACASSSNRSTPACWESCLGYLAVKSGSLLPGVVFHFLHNSMMRPQREGHARADRPRARPRFPRATRAVTGLATSGPSTSSAA